MLDAAQYALHPHASHIPEDRAAERVIAIPGTWTAPRPFDPNAGVALGADIEAFINEGRWIAECPDCHGAQLTAESDPRLMCVNCGNSATGGQWRRVRWPKSRARIEQLLEQRPTRNQHWWPGESVSDLAKENAERAAEMTGR